MSQPPKPLLKVKDFAVSGEEFQLVLDETYQLYKTSPQPSPIKLPNYYQSEDYISHTDHQRNLKEKLYFFVKQIALKNKLKLLNSFKTESRNLLDIGCGTGDFLKVAAQHDWSIKGIEPNEKARDIANSKLHDKVYNVEMLEELTPQSFDVITLWHVLEHLPNLQDNIKIIKRLLKPNGILIVAVPNYKCYDAKHYKSYWAAFDVPRHLWHFSKFAISKLFGDHHMKVHQIKPMYFDSFYVSLLSEYYKTGKHNYFKAFWIGFKSNYLAIHSGEYSSQIYIINNKEN